MLLVRGRAELDAVECHSLAYSACRRRGAVGQRMEEGGKQAWKGNLVKLLELSLKSFSQSVLGFCFVNFFFFVFL